MATLLSKDEYQELTYLYDEEELYPRYSGRGMYGDTCLGYVGSEPHLFVFDLAKILAERDIEEPDADDIRSEMSRLGSGSTDSMGYDTIYYFRSIQVDVPEEDEDDE